ncbi:DUF340 domain-containing protein [Sulfolobus sp. E5-1-F]|uniref:lysine exporter LysO family protein n=1 Tax=Sulfolobaceae TaxID=118883 RepID=UPI00129726EF|nr:MULTISPECIES: lysine exporter LysO family protein [unclassified Sulfolobus]QGA53348.1 DUF340 domain-containing protein [Sulfolobus sp. E5-1-F]QGA68455.1 DUF340 domain-containing protein [Sulfolobus sp. E11-6]
MNSISIFFIILYLIFLVIGKIKYVKRVEKIVDIVVILLILSISYWAGEEIASNQIFGLLINSLILGTLSIIITYFSGVAIRHFSNTKPLMKAKREKMIISNSNKQTIIKYMLPFVIGWILGLLFHISNTIIVSLVDYELYALASVLGYIMGKDVSRKVILRSSKDSLISLFITILGDIILALVMYMLHVTTFTISLAIALASGWYSYVGPLVAVNSDPYLGTLAFLVNFLREQLTYVLVPLLLKLKFEPRSAIAVGGATSMDTTLPLYVEVLGKDYALSAMISGVILTIVIPIILPLIV